MPTNLPLAAPPPTSILELSDTPPTFGAPLQYLGEAGADLEFVDQGIPMCSIRRAEFRFPVDQQVQVPFNGVAGKLATLDTVTGTMTLRSGISSGSLISLSIRAKLQSAFEPGFSSVVPVLNKIHMSTNGGALEEIYQQRDIDGINQLNVSFQLLRILGSGDTLRFFVEAIPDNNNQNWVQDLNNFIVIAELFQG